MAAGVFRFFFAFEGKIVLRGERVVKSIEQVKIPAESGIFSGALMADLGCSCHCAQARCTGSGKSSG